MTLPRSSNPVRAAAAAWAFALALSLSATAAPPAADEAGPAGAWRIVLRTGRSLTAESWQVSGGFLKIHLEGGGSVGVPVDLVLRTERLAADDALASGLTPLDPGEGASCDPWTDERVSRWETLAGDAAERHGLSASLVRAVIAAESCGDPRAVSTKGAMGLMQLMPATAADYGVADAYDPEANVDAGCQHLARLKAVLGDDLDVVLAAYNAGEGVVQKAGGVPDYRETRDYVRRVKGWLARAEATGS